MRDFPSCFGENGVQIADSSSSSGSTRIPQNLVTCIYGCKLFGKSCFITITWTKTLMGQGFGIEIIDSKSHCLSKMDIKPWLFSKRKGFKGLEVNSSKIDIFWDLSSTKFGSGPEPVDGFYLAIVFDGEIVLLLGDMRKEAFKKTNASPNFANAILISKREHVFGKRVFGTKAQFYDDGKVHDLTIECDEVSVTDPCLAIRVDGKVVLQVKRLKWKFRGNHTILVDGVPVEVFWDVHTWLFGTALGNAVFMFQSCVSDDKLWANQSFTDPVSSDWSCSRGFKGSKFKAFGFSLILYAWKNE